MTFDITKENELLLVAKKFIFKILEAGEKYYSPEENDKGIIMLSPKMIMELTNDLIGKPIIIGHSKISENNIDNVSNIVVGRITKAFLNTEGFKTADGYQVEADNSSYAEGIIDKQTGLDYIEKGYLPSIYYTILEEKRGSKGKIEVTNAETNHLGLVAKPKYDTAIYNFNNKQINLMNKQGAVIANGSVSPTAVEPNNEIVNSGTMQEALMDTDLFDLYVKDEEGNEYLLSDIYEGVKEELGKKYYDKEVIVKNGKSYVVKNMISMYKSKMVKNSAEKPEDNMKNKIENSEGNCKTETKENDDVKNGKSETLISKGVGAITRAFENLSSSPVTIYHATGGIKKPNEYTKD